MLRRIRPSSFPTQLSANTQKHVSSRSLASTSKLLTTLNPTITTTVVLTAMGTAVAAASYIAHKKEQEVNEEVNKLINEAKWKKMLEIPMLNEAKIPNKVVTALNESNEGRNYLQNVINSHRIADKTPEEAIHIKLKEILAALPQNKRLPFFLSLKSNSYLKQDMPAILVLFPEKDRSGVLDLLYAEYNWNIFFPSDKCLLETIKLLPEKQRLYYIKQSYYRCYNIKNLSAFLDILPNTEVDQLLDSLNEDYVKSSLDLNLLKRILNTHSFKNIQLTKGEVKKLIGSDANNLAKLLETIPTNLQEMILSLCQNDIDNIVKDFKSFKICATQLKGNTYILAEALSNESINKIISAQPEIIEFLRSLDTKSRGIIFKKLEKPTLANIQWEERLIMEERKPSIW